MSSGPIMATDSLARGGSQASLRYIWVEGQCLFPAYHHSHLDTPVWVAPLRPVLPIPRRSRRQVRSRRIGGAESPQTPPRKLMMEFYHQLPTVQQPAAPADKFRAAYTPRATRRFSRHGRLRQRPGRFFRQSRYRRRNSESQSSPASPCSHVAPPYFPAVVVAGSATWG